LFADQEFWAEGKPVNQPLVSVVTPFHNTAEYLAQCIQSVLGQTYQHFEYILVDNCSTDGAADIAESFGQRDSRIRVIHRPKLLSQVQNYNAALADISTESKYCKIVQADDYIFPDCLKLMVQAFEQSDSIGLVSSYWLKGNTVCGSGIPHGPGYFHGKEIGRMYLRAGLYFFGSPTTVMYRSRMIREQKPFYKENLRHEDTEKCMQILEHSEFGFVLQILSFLRLGNGSISSSARTYSPQMLDWYIITQRYAPVFLDDNEAKALRRDSKRQYYKTLAHQALQLRDRAFWQYHKEGLTTLGETLDHPYLACQIGLELLRMVANPGSTIASMLRLMQGKKESKGFAKTVDPVEPLRRIESK
jgi:glycosyltransferase involved in cell wall biosynthesis